MPETQPSPEFCVVALDPAGFGWSVKRWAAFANLKGKQPEDSSIGYSGSFSVGTVVE